VRDFYRARSWRNRLQLFVTLCVVREDAQHAQNATAVSVIRRSKTSLRSGALPIPMATFFFFHRTSQNRHPERSENGIKMFVTPRHGAR
jgi:hypothetical protein